MNARSGLASRFEHELSLARRAVPVFGLARRQHVLWSVRLRLRGKTNEWRRIVSLVAVACLVGSLAAAYAWFWWAAGPRR